MTEDDRGDQPTTSDNDDTAWHKFARFKWEDLEDVPISPDSVPTSTEAETSGEPIVSFEDTPAARLEQAQAEEQEQKNSFRGILFWCILVACGVGYVLTAVMVIVYLLNHPETPVMVGWISAGVVQLVGLTYIVARYVFPSSAK